MSPGPGLKTHGTVSGAGKQALISFLFVSQGSLRSYLILCARNIIIVILIIPALEGFCADELTHMEALSVKSGI